MLEVCLDVDPEPEQVAVVRAWVRQTLVEWELADLVDATLLATSELVTNAVLHARTPFRVTLRADSSTGVRVEVTDDNPRPPVRAADDEGATSGRGLQVVVGVASGWGTVSDGTGKTVWAEIGTTEPDDDESADCLDLRGARSVEDALARIDEHGERPSNDRPAPGGAPA